MSNPVIKHQKNVTVPDGPDTDVVRPSDWNENHQITQTTGRVLGRVTAGTGATEELTPEQVRALLALGTAAIVNVGKASDQVPTNGDLIQARADIASATTTDIGAASSEYLRVTGTTTITGLGTAAAGVVRDLLFADVLTLTHNATSLINLSGADITTAAGDVALFRSEGSGNWRMVRYSRANGAALAISSAGPRNLLINPLGTINQRGYTSGTATSGAFQYTVDRWRVVTSGQSLSWTESEGVRTFTAPAGGVEQVIEGANILSGAHALNWEGTATATVNGTTRTKGESFTLTGGANATVRFSGGTFSKPQLEPGSAVSPFERRPTSTEERLCMRYYEVAGGPGASGAVASCPFANGFASSTWFFKERKRATPTISFGFGSEGDGDNTTIDYVRIFSSSTNAAIIAGSTANAEL